MINYNQKKSVVVAIFLFIPALIFSQIKPYKVITQWETDKNSNGILFQYRKIGLTDTTENRQMRVLIKIEAGIDAILKNFTNEDLLIEWAASSKKCHVKIINDSNWITYTLFDIPKPLAQRDLVTKYSQSKTQKDVLVQYYAMPDILPPLENVSRMRDYTGEWKFKYLSDNQTLVEFSTISLTKPPVPRFIQDPILQNIFIKSFIRLKELSEGI